MPAPGILTFRDYIVLAAEELGVASYGPNNTGAAQVPDDLDHLTACKKIVNAGLGRFYTARPKWEFMTQEVQLALVAGDTSSAIGMVDNQNWKYFMPVTFTGQMFGTWEYTEDGPVGIAIQDVQARDIRRFRTLSRGSTKGYPLYAALVPPVQSAGPDSGAVGGGSERWQAWFYPAPSLNVTIARFCRLRPWVLRDLDDLPMAAAQNQDIYRQAVLAEAEQSRKTVGQHTGLFGQMLAAAMELDDAAGPKHLGYNGDPSNQNAGVDRARLRTKGGVVSYNGMATY